MRRTNRLASAARIKNLYETGRRASSAAAGCVAIVGVGGPPRVAVVAGRKAGGAVARNRAKRRLRAAIGPLVEQLELGTEAVVGATSRTNEVSFQELEAQVAGVLRRVGVLHGA